MTTYIKSVRTKGGTSPTITTDVASFSHEQHLSFSWTETMSAPIDPFFEISKFLETPTLELEKHGGGRLH